MTSVRWDRDALLANPAFESLWPVIALCPSHRFPEAGDLSDLAQARGAASGGGAALRFVSAGGSVPRGFEQQYEVRIYRDGEVRTRADNFHDLFNALAWLAFPRTKALLNRKHCEAMMARKDAGSRGTARKDAGSRGTTRKDAGSRGTARKDAGSRGTARDVLTLFDESGVIAACSEAELEALLRGFEWKTLFCTRRADVRRAMRFFLFGHGIHEKALHPFKGLTAKALVLRVSPGFSAMPLDLQLAEADGRAAQRLAQASALDSTRMLAPLPILGVPGWEAANERESFYDDASVFRPGRSG
ncbi:MAG: hypothetical protein A3G26_01675 [Betaproteobacteria bacterium RIFCSPLOWO2_12_FULL_65_110]|nr:MAG: hypothetical protein A3G26_01675 [Betaproteobacteria bacterium RIFCSPLOWO2_12_FULL_65_110]